MRLAVVLALSLHLLLLVHSLLGRRLLLLDLLLDLLPLLLILDFLHYSQQLRGSVTFAGVLDALVLEEVVHLLVVPRGLALVENRLPLAPLPLHNLREVDVVSVLVVVEVGASHEHSLDEVLLSLELKLQLLNLFIQRLEKFLRNQS